MIDKRPLNLVHVPLAGGSPPGQGPLVADGRVQ